MPHVGDLSHAETRRGGEFFSRKERKDHKAGGPTSVSATIDRSRWKRVRLGEALTNVGWCNYSHLQPRQVRKVTQGDDTGEVSITTDYYHPASPVVLFGDHTCNVKYVDFDCLILGDGVKLLTPNHEVFSTRFLYYLVQYVASKVPQGYARHLAVLKETECALPCYEDQFKIANAITSIDTHISALQALIAKYEAIKKATVNLLLKPKSDWRQISLGDIGDVLMCKRILKNQTTETGDVPFYKIGTFGRTPDSFISRALFKDFKARFSYPKKGDVLLSAAGTIGRTVVFNGEDAYFQDSNIVWIDNDECAVTNRFLNVLYGQMNWQTENGGTVSRLYNTNIRNTKIKIPSLSEQKRIVAILDSIDGTINGLKSQLAKAQDIKQGMMSYFFG